MAEVALADINKIPVIKKVAILGAGVMGAQIAAHFANAGIPALLFDLPAEGKDNGATADKSATARAHSTKCD